MISLAIPEIRATVSLLIPTYTDIYRLIPSFTKMGYPSQNNFSIPTYTGISWDKSHIWLSLDIASRQQYCSTAWSSCDSRTLQRVRVRLDRALKSNLDSSRQPRRQVTALSPCVTSLSRWLEGCDGHIIMIWALRLTGIQSYSLELSLVTPSPG